MPVAQHVRLRGSAPQSTGVVNRQAFDAVRVGPLLGVHASYLKTFVFFAPGRRIMSASYFGELVRGGESPRAAAGGSRSSDGGAASTKLPRGESAEGSGAAPKPAGAAKPTKIKTSRGKSTKSSAKTPTWLQRGVAADGRTNTRTIGLDKVCGRTARRRDLARSARLPLTRRIDRLLRSLSLR